MGAFTRRSLLLGAGAAVGIAGSRWWSNENIPAGQPFPATNASGTVLNDASLLSPTPVHKHIVKSDDPSEAFIESLRNELAEAKSERRPFCVSAARHSMGGQSLPKDGTAITLDQNWLEADRDNALYRVAAGMRWNNIIKRLDDIDFSPAVMQSNNDFGVASTFCVNAHGWPVPFSGMGSTVYAFKMMLADGELVECSREKNPDLFDATMGGYGLTGIITELDVDMVPNSRLLPTYEVIQGKNFGTKLMETLKGNEKIQMAYGRLDVRIDGFFDEGLMITYAPTTNQGNLPEASSSGFLSHASRHIFRSQLQSDRMKGVRWFVETELGPNTGGGEVTRNSLINEPVVTLDDRDPTRTDILHEYFVAPERFAEFVDACQDVIPSSYQELLNITLRYVKMDEESLLSYAPVDRIACVMLFSQEMSTRSEADMHRMTEALIERTLAIGGTYYLPYRLHARQDQFRRGYPKAQEFAALKRQIDPGLLFRNSLWDKYMGLL